MSKIIKRKYKHKSRRRTMRQSKKRYKRTHSYRRKYTRHIKYGGGVGDTRLFLTYDSISDPGAEWGGIHVTIVGNGDNQPSMDLVKETNFFKTYNDNWTLPGDYQIRNQPVGGYEGNIFILAFESDTLNDLSAELAGKGFNNIKGPKLVGSDPGMTWHASLPGLNETEAVNKARELLEQKWFLTTCTQNEDGTYTWQKL